MAPIGALLLIQIGADLAFRHAPGRFQTEPKVQRQRIRYPVVILDEPESVQRKVVTYEITHVLSEENGIALLEVRHVGEYDESSPKQVKRVR
jgi:hypothetical protein